MMDALPHLAAVNASSAPHVPGGHMLSTSSPLNVLPPQAFSLLSHDLPRTVVYMLIPFELLYFALYFKLHGHARLYRWLTFASLAALWASKVLAPIRCGPFQSLHHLAIAIGTMKTLDLFARRNALPQYTCSTKQPPAWHLALLLLTELRYESFTPSSIRVSKDGEGFSEPLQLAVHLGIFAVLQSAPQRWPVVLAFEVLLAVYCIWTAMQLCVRYKSSPALFGPLYRAQSLAGFWSSTWHNAFTSPCNTLAYLPVRTNLPRLGLPEAFARSTGVLAAFTLMGLFHVYACLPIVPRAGLFRIALFFFLNGVATVVEVSLWGRRNHWLRCALAWAFEAALAAWTAEGLGVPNGLSRVRWGELCERGF